MLIRMATKDAGLRIRIEKDLREAFMETCHAQDRKAADVLREFMEHYVRSNGNGRQPSLFPSALERKR